jgi:hypothetical protein
MDYKWKQLILVVYVLFGLKVNEIPNKAFLLDSHWPLKVSVFSFMVQLVPGKIG